MVGGFLASKVTGGLEMITAMVITPAATPIPTCNSRVADKASARARLRFSRTLKKAGAGRPGAGVTGWTGGAG
jgi:hypothetical protein